MPDKLRVVVMTQADRFFIPKNIDKVASACELLEVVEVDCRSALENRTKDYLKWFGFWQCAKMGAVTIGREAEKYLDRVSGYRLFHGWCSVMDAARKNHIPHRVITNSNDPAYVQHIRELNPDLIISYSAPQIIKPELLGVPKYGVINVHGALLPNYRGCTLHEREDRRRRYSGAGQRGHLRLQQHVPAHEEDQGRGRGAYA